MPLRQAARLPVGDPDTDVAITEVRDVVNAIITNTPPLDGKLFEGVVLADGVIYRLRHGLPRRARWMIADLAGCITTGRLERIVPSTTNPYDPKVELWLKATGYGASITVSLWVF
jgi:hypothetical protein